MMVNFRNNPPKTLGGSVLRIVKDYETLVEKDLVTGAERPINQKITSNVLQFFTEDGTKISVRLQGQSQRLSSISKLPPS
jgi:phosphoglucomutase